MFLRTAEEGAPAPLVAATRADDRAHGVGRSPSPLFVPRCRPETHEDAAGWRPAPLPEVAGSQAQVLQRTVEPFVDAVPLVLLLDDPVPQTVEQLQDVLQFFDRLSTLPEHVLEVPKILPEDVPMRAVLRATQLAEQLVEVPTIISIPTDCRCCRRFWSTSSGLWSRTLTFQLVDRGSGAG